MKSLIVGWYGHGNIGDELLSIAAYKIFQDAFGTPPIIASVNPEITSNNLSELIPDATAKIVRWPVSASPKNLMSTSFIKTFSSIIESSCVAIGGGGMLSDWKGSKVHRWLEFISFCKKLGKKTILLGIGAGPFFDSAIASRIGNIINNDVDLIIARDEMSKTYLKEEAGVTNRIEVLPDLVYYLRDIIKRNAEKKDLLVANFVPFPDLSSGYEKGIIEFLEDATQDRVVELLPFHYSDWKFHKKVSEKVKSSNLRVLPLEDIKNTIEILSSAEVAVLTRFHSIILGSLMGIPMVPLIYHHKSAELTHSLGIDEYSIDIGDGSQWKNNIPSLSDYQSRMEQVKHNLKEISSDMITMSDKQLTESRKYVLELRKISK